MAATRSSLPKKSSLHIDGGAVSPEDRFLASVKEKAKRNLKVLRVDTGLSAKDLAEAAGIGHSMLKAIEAGNRSLQIHQAFRIAKETGVDISSLMSGSILFEWGGKDVYTSTSFRKWVSNGKKPSPEQKLLTTQHLNRKVDQSTQIARRLGPDYEAYLAALLDLFMDSYCPEGPLSPK